MLVSLGCLPWVVESLGWNWAFYSSGILALMWTPLWFLLVRDDPLRHPCIAHKERELLKEITIQTKVRKELVTLSILASCEKNCHVVSGFYCGPRSYSTCYSGTITGLAGVGQLGGFLAPIVNSHLINKDNGLVWVVGVAGGLYCLVGLVYVLAVKAQVHGWNDYQQIPEGESYDHHPKQQQQQQQ
ncbi:hypothetical protein Pmani_002975 [Petrolisthes manimaculis]|uniref:Uncharacterized protein n=1 Tax=Petrolisthes manimaculis TaxID=1843537 RepID=A0AAE1UIX0_9EUCA|nr:hypothetical protein Pmani_002975 [Petrolisthes manimaculis]